MTLFDSPSLITRIAVGKVIGLMLGLCGFFALPYLMPEAGWQLRWGILLWYPTMGAVIGAFGVLTSHPVLRLPLPWWVRAPLIGAWMNFVLVFFAYAQMQNFLETGFGDVISSPFWFVLEGALIGAVIGYVATRFGIEGTNTTAEPASAGA